MAKLKTLNVGAFEAKTRLSELLEQVHRDGSEITITRHGTPVAKLVPVRAALSAGERRLAINRWQKTSRSLSLNGISIRDLIEQGRKW